MTPVTSPDVVLVEGGPFVFSLTRGNWSDEGVRNTVLGRSNGNVLRIDTRLLSVLFVHDVPA